MKNIIWPMIHKFTLHSNICIVKYPWGFISQDKILSITNQSLPKTRYILSEKCNEMYILDNSNFLDGVKNGYNIIYDKFKNKENFLDYNYTTPKLSCALNFIRGKIKNEINIDSNNIKVEIIAIWESIGNSKSNNKLLGLWDSEYIKHQIIAGSIGPEVSYIWDQKPIKQTVRVLYKLNDRVDLLDWERCLMVNDYEWKVSNINNIIIK